MNRLTNTLEELKNKSKKALVAYLVAGDPDIETTLELMTVLVESGVDIIEIGVPFTDPIAEGPIIQKAHDRALKNNVSLKSIFEMVEKFRKNDNDTPLVLMGYLNKNDVIDSVLVVDIPGELKLKDYGVYNPNINTISLISPTTKKDRIESIAKNSSGFVYYVTLRGVTGASNLDVNEISSNIEEIKKHASVPTLAGFGIKSAEDAKLLSQCSDGVIIGSSIVHMIEESSKSKEFDRIRTYITDIKKAISWVFFKI